MYSLLKRVLPSFLQLIWKAVSTPEDNEVSYKAEVNFAEAAKWNEAAAAFRK